MQVDKIKGIIVPIVTPMNDDESINYEELKNHIDRLIDAGAHGIFPCGTNGEAYILSNEEKIELFKKTVEYVGKRVPVYAGTGCIGTKDTIELSKKAEEIGVDVLSIVTPSFAKASQYELYTHYCEIDKEVNIPILLYNIPARTGNALEPETVKKIAQNTKNIIGAKDSSGNWDNLKAYIQVSKELDKEFRILSGNDSLILDALIEGGKGAIAGCANVYPKTLVSIYECFVEGKLEKARQAQDSIGEFRGVFKYGNPNTITKLGTKLLGHKVGDCRRPFNYLSQEGMEELKRVLKKNQENGME